MCLQCETDSELFGSPGDHDFLPGWSLHRATKSAPGEWEAGEFGIVRCNNPSIIFSCKLLKNPGDEGGEEALREYDHDVIALYEAIRNHNLGIIANAEFLMAAVAAGFPLESQPDLPPNKYSSFKRIFKSTDRDLAEWLYDRIVQWVATHPGLTHEQWLAATKRIAGIEEDNI